MNRCIEKLLTLYYCTKSNLFHVVCQNSKVLNTEEELFNRLVEFQSQ